MGAGRQVLAIVVAVAALSLVAAPVRAEAAGNCVLTGDGGVYCWSGAAPVRIHVTGRVVQLAASGDGTCALTEPGEVYCWGPNLPVPGSGPDPLLLVTIGTLLVAGGAALLRLSRRGGAAEVQPAAAVTASRNAPAPSLSRSA